ncbi:hypothetical protein Athai_17630 [Actinocatenispora thailandica]|uniref:Glycosyltransferase RgtA/B/C/D-like domain-containing protein n=1 Tax=Actinocatenispora thailandica TaxID=227318 RepID=A0A7R7DM82_9ACTN|nr:hypothetical protein Athai_17630 [Actinocatenispora thailandica]
MPRRGRFVPTVALYAVGAALGLAVAWWFPWSGDTGLHIAVVEQLSRHLGDPPDPLVGAHAASPYYSPYSLVQALLARVTGLGGYDVLRVSALGNALLIASGLHHLVRRLSTAPWAPLAALVAILLLQGTTLLTWSGFLGLQSLAITLSYPAAFALGVTLHLWGLVAARLVGRGGPWTFPVAGLLAADVVLDHQFTAVAAALGCLALVVGGRRRLNLVEVACWSAAVAIAAAALATWPYFPVLSLLSSTGGLDRIQAPLYHHLLGFYGLGLATGIPALALRVYRRRTDPLAWLAVLAGLFVGYGWVTGHATWARLLPAVLLAGQLAVGIEVAEQLARRPGTGRGRLTVAAAALGCLVALPTQAGVLHYAAPLPASLDRHLATKRDWVGYGWVTRWIGTGRTVLAGTYHAARMLPGYRIFTLAPAYPEPWLRSAPARRAARAAILDPATGHARRAALLGAYRIRFLVVYPGQAAALRHAGVRLHELGRSPRFGHDVLYRVARA